MQKVNSCCCGCSLKTGTLILLILSLVVSVLKILGSFGAPGNQAGTIIGYLILLGISIAGIYAAMQEKPVFLIPYMVIQLLGLVGLIITMLALLIFGSAVIAYLAENTTNNPKEVEELKKQGFIGIVICEIIFAIFAGLSYYFFIVVLSFFKSLRSGSQ